MERCGHVASVSGQQLSDAILDPARWACAECGTTESVWACLVCFRVSCGRYIEGHALSHSSRSGHPLSMEINQGFVFCYDCDDYVLNDTAGGDLRLLRDVLTTIAAQDSPDKSSRALRAHQTSTSSTSLQQAVLRHRRVSTLSKAFTAWRDLTASSKRRSNRPRWERQKATTTTTTTKEAEGKGGRDATQAETSSSTISPRRKRRMSQSSSDVPLGVTGLRNLGNTCYMNSVLQVLSNLDEFRDRFLALCPLQVDLVGAEENAKMEEGAGGRGKLREEIQALLRVMNSGKMSLVIPDGFLQALWTAVPSFRGYRQQDAQEFLCQVLDKLGGDLGSVEEADEGGQKKAKKKKRGQGGESLAETAMKDLVSELFNGELESLVRCGHCGKESLRREAFSDLSLEFPPAYQECRLTSLNLAKDSCPLEEMLARFTAPEELGPVYACTHCSGRRSRSTQGREALKQIRLSRLPRLLRLHLKRFRWSGRNQRDKISIHVSFPERLEMGAYVVDGEGEAGGKSYTLCGLVQHHGRGFNTGHYTSFCWNSRGPFWIHCNDARLELCSLQDVLEAQAYILFYRQTSAKESQSHSQSQSRSSPDLLSDSESSQPNLSKKLRRRTSPRQNS